jgi:hypothetical protein
VASLMSSPRLYRKRNARSGSVALQWFKGYATGKPRTFDRSARGARPRWEASCPRGINVFFYVTAELKRARSVLA